MPRTDEKPLAIIMIQKPGKVTPIEFKEIPEKELRFDKLKINRRKKTWKILRS